MDPGINGQQKAVNGMARSVLWLPGCTLLLVLPRLGGAMSGGGGDQGFGQTCDAVTICPERSMDGVMIPQVRPPLQCCAASQSANRTWLLHCVID